MIPVVLCKIYKNDQFYKFSMKHCLAIHYRIRYLVKFQVNFTLVETMLFMVFYKILFELHTVITCYSVHCLMRILNNPHSTNY